MEAIIILVTTIIVHIPQAVLSQEDLLEVDFLVEVEHRVHGKHRNIMCCLNQRLKLTG